MSMCLARSAKENAITEKLSISKSVINDDKDQLTPRRLSWFFYIIMI